MILYIQQNSAKLNFYCFILDSLGERTPFPNSGSIVLWSRVCMCGAIQEKKTPP